MDNPLFGPNGEIDPSIATNIPSEAEMLTLLVHHPDALGEPDMNSGLFSDATHQQIYELLADYHENIREPWSFVHLCAHAKRIPGLWENIDGPGRFIPLWNGLQPRENYRFLHTRLCIWRAKREAIIRAREIQQTIYRDINLDINSAALFRTAGAFIERIAPLAGTDVLSGKNPLAFSKCPLDLSTVLAGNRWFSRLTANMIVAPTGIGKSMAVTQLLILWAAGLPAFAIAPKGPLKILMVQAEDDPNDVAEMCQCIKRLALTAAQQELVANNAHIEWVNDCAGDAFFRRLREILFALRNIGKSPDVLILNPLSAYLDKDPRDPLASMQFFRRSLVSLMHEFSFGTLIVHHTPKTQFMGTDKFKDIDWAYAGAGSADIYNFIRAELIIWPTNDQNVFSFKATKRGERIGWFNTRELFFAHSVLNNIALWIPASKEQELDAKADPKSAKSKQSDQLKINHILNLIPLIDPIPRRALKAKLSIGNEKFKDLIDFLLYDGQIFLHILPTAHGGRKTFAYAKSSPSSAS